jgi:hypothetical protein
MGAWSCSFVFPGPDWQDCLHSTVVSMEPSVATHRHGPVRCRRLVGLLQEAHVADVHVLQACNEVLLWLSVDSGYRVIVTVVRCMI